MDCFGTLRVPMTISLRSLWFIAGLFLPHCGAPGAPGGPRASEPAPPSMSPDAAGAELGPAPAGSVTEHAETPSESNALVFSRDDFDGAILRARQNDRLVFVDAWAEWCHTCLSMDSVVLADPSLRPFASQYEFVAIDTEKSVNAAFVGRYAMDTWPTFFVVRPDDLSLVGFWPGAASVSEMREFLEQSLDAAAALETGTVAPHLEHFLAARAAHSQADEARAVEHYERAYRAMPSDWPRRSELWFGFIDALSKTKRFPRCAEIGKRHLDQVTGAAKPAGFAQRYFTCLSQLRAADRDVEVERALQKLGAIARSPAADTSFDDRVDALLMLSTAYGIMGRKQEATAVLAERLALAEQGAREAKDSTEARAFDRVRVLAYLELGRSDDALNLLAESERAHPHGYATPALLAEVFQRMGQHDRGLEALERAIENSEGPRRADYLVDQADWLHRLERYDAEVASLERLVRELSALRGASAQQRLQRTKERLRALQAGPDR